MAAPARRRQPVEHSQESLTVLAARDGINEKTVAKWRVRGFVHDAPMGPKDLASMVLTKRKKRCAPFRRHMPLPLDDCLYALQPTILHLSRSTLHRCYQRYGISRVPDLECAKPKEK